MWTQSEPFNHRRSLCLSPPPPRPSGELTIARSLDFESHKEHHLLIGLFYPDQPNSRISYISLVVHVIDVNEFAPLFQSPTNLVVASDASVESTIGRISAFDPDFREDSETGIIYSITPSWFYDLIVKSLYSLTIFEQFSAKIY